MTATVGDLIGRARSQVRDPDGSFITDEDFITWANEAITDLAARTEITQGEKTGTTSTNAIALPSGLSPGGVQILSLRLGSDGDDVEFVTDATWNSWSDNADTPSNTLGRVFNGNIELYPTPVSGTAYGLRYSTVPLPLGDVADEQPLPQQMERKIVEYMVAQAKYKDSEVGEGDRWLGRYEQGLPPPNLGRGMIQPGPLTFLAEPNWFERDPEALL